MLRLPIWRVALFMVALAAVLLLTSTTYAAPTLAPCTYTVRAGDTLGAIARRYNTTVATLAELNGITNPNLIDVGQALTIPDCDGAPPSPPPPSRGPAPGPAAPTVPLRVVSIDSVPTPKEIDQPLLDRAVGATINVVVETRLGFTASGTGTVVGGDGKTFLTAFHVVGDNESGWLYPTTEIRVGPFRDFSLRARVIATAPEHDLALLRVEDAEEFDGFSFVPLGDSDKMQLGDTIYTLSYPGVARGGLVTTKGSLLSTISLVEDEAIHYFLTDAHASPGSSGGVAINERGEVIGIVSAVIFRRSILDRLGLPQINRATMVVPINWAQPLMGQ